MHRLSAAMEAAFAVDIRLEAQTPPGVHFGRSYVKNTFENQRCTGDLPIRRGGGEAEASMP